MSNTSTISISEVNAAQRLDSEYFLPEFLKVATKLKEIDNVRLGQLAKIDTSAFYPAATELYASGDVAFARVVDTIDYPVITDIQEFARIPENFLAAFKQQIKVAKKNDIIISKVGTPCYSSIVDESIDKIALSRTVLGVFDIQGINPKYLMVFLRTKYGFFQLMRERELTIQLQLTLERVRNILISTPPKNFQEQIAKLVDEHTSHLRAFTKQYHHAESVFLNEVGFNESNLKDSLTYESHFSEVINSGRVDSEFHKPKYRKMISKIECSLKKLGELADISKGIEIGSNEYVESGTHPFLRVSNISKFGVISGESQEYLSQKLFEILKKDYQPKSGEILLTKDATLGTAYLLEETPSAIISSGILRLISPKINSKYLALALNSRVVQEQIKQSSSSGSILNHWSIEYVKNTLIPVLSTEKQNNLAKIVSDAFKERQLAIEKLGKAQKLVENYIEAK